MIRPAVPSDVPRIVEMGSHFRDESEYAELLTDNPAQREAMAVRLIEGADSIVLVSEDGGRLTGMIGLLLYAHHLSAELICGEVFWWVEPEARGAGIKLLRAAEKWAAVNEAKKLQMIAPNSRVGRLYERFGYQLIELNYQKQVAVA